MTSTPSAGLTREFLAGLSAKQVFRPQSVDEAEYIASQLLGIGFPYYKPEYAAQLQKAVGGSIYLDTDKTIMVSESTPDGTMRSADEFMVVLGEPRAFDKTLLEKPLAVFPRSVGEGRGVLINLASAGAIDAEETQNSFAKALRAVRQGMVVKGGKVIYGPRAEDLQGAKIVTAADLGVGIAGGMTAEQAVVHAAFNEMAARMEQMAARIERLEDAVLPKTLEKKASLPKPGPKPGIGPK